MVYDINFTFHVNFVVFLELFLHYFFEIFETKHKTYLAPKISRAFIMEHKTT